MNEHAKSCAFNARYFAHSALVTGDGNDGNDGSVNFEQARTDGNSLSPLRGRLFRHELGVNS